jgi:hypothetical protein
MYMHTQYMEASRIPSAGGRGLKLPDEGADVLPRTEVRTNLVLACHSGRSGPERVESFSASPFAFFSKVVALC